jgi:hypothetical protein
MVASASFGRDEIHVSSRGGVCWEPCDGYRWDVARDNEEPTCGRSAKRACQLESSWSRDDHEDGGPTIQLPAAGARCTLRLL